MPNPFEFWAKSMEAFQQLQSEFLQPATLPTPVKEFTIKHEGNDLDPTAITIFVEGKWIDLNEFVERYRNIRHELHNLI